jgi:hypothetical protein
MREAQRISGAPTTVALTCLFNYLRISSALVRTQPPSSAT